MDVSKTHTPEQDIEYPSLNLSPDTRSSLAVAISEGLDTVKADREILDVTLDYWNDMVEMNVAPRDEPWPNAKSMCVPIVAMMMEQVDARLTDAVFVPRLYVVNGLTPQAQQFQHDTENWYNSEFRRRRWLRQHLDCQKLSLRDGVSVMEILWEERTVERDIVVMEPTGEIGPDGKPKKKKARRRQTQIEFKGPRLEPVELRDLILFPAVATDIQKAEAVYRRLYLTESDLWELVESGTLWRDAVESIIQTHSPGQNDLQGDPDGTATYEQGGELQAGGTGSMDFDDDSRSRGIFEIWRGHDKRFDLDGDGVCEENVLWYYDRMPTLLGAGPFAYWHGKRPFAKCAPMPRPNRFQGWAVPERLRGYQEEANARSNQRGDAMDIKLSPPMYRIAGATLITKDRKWGPGAEWEVPAANAVGIIDVGTIDPASWQDEMLTYRYAAAMVGIEAPTMPLSGGQKIPMKQQQQMMVASNVRLNLMALEVRLFCEEVLWHIHHLYLQYGDDAAENDLNSQGMETLQPAPNGGMRKFKLPFEALVQDYFMGIAGADGAIDQDSERSQAMTLYAMLLQNPLVQGDLPKVHAVTEFALSKYNLADYTRFIGTVQDAQSKQQQMAQAQQQQHDEQMQLQMLSHAKNPSPMNGKPPAGPPPPTGPQPPGTVPQMS